MKRTNRQRSLPRMHVKTDQYSRATLQPPTGHRNEELLGGYRPSAVRAKGLAALLAIVATLSLFQPSFAAPLQISDGAPPANRSLNLNDPPIRTSIYFEDFESGEGGWQSITPQQVGVKWHRVTADIGDGPRTVWWVGEEDPCHSSGLGYGNDWNQIITKSFALGSAPISLDLVHQYDTEPDYDFCLVEVSSDGGTSFDGIVSLHGDSGGYTSDSFDLSAYAGQNVIIRLRFSSDSAYSDEDTQLDTNGAWRVDALTVTGFATNTFDVGDDGWTPSAGPNVITEAPVSFQLRLEPPCDLIDFTNCFNTGYAFTAWDPALDRVPEVLEYGVPAPRLATILSPSIAIPAGADRVFVEADIFTDTSRDGAIFDDLWYTYRVLSTGTDGCPRTAPAAFMFWHGLGTGWAHRSFDITSLISAGATEFQIEFSQLDAANILPQIGLQPSGASQRGVYFDNMEVITETDVPPGPGCKLFALNHLDPADTDVLASSADHDGNVAILGAPFKDGVGNSSGAAYLFDLTTGDQLFKLEPNDSAAGDEFGYNVAIDGNLALVGSRKSGGTGAAYLFDVSTGAQLQKLTSTDGANNDFFGMGVALSGNLALVGAFLDDDAGTSSGSAYLFDATTGIQLHKLTAGDAAAGDQFGFSVAIDGNTVVIGAGRHDAAGSDAGAVYVFDASSGLQANKLTATDAAALDGLGFAVAVSGNLAIASAQFDDDLGSDSGSAYVFNVITGAQVSKLSASDGAAGHTFGTSVDIDGALAIVGASQSNGNTGSAYIFEASSGLELSIQTPDPGSSGDQFGAAVSIGGGLAVVGAPRSHGGTTSDSGFACVINAAFIVVPPNEDPDCSLAAIADQTADGNCQALISTADLTGVTDPDAGDILTISVSPTTLSLGANTVTVSADDGNGGLCSIDITVNVVGGTGTISGNVSDGTAGLDGVTVKLLDDTMPTTVFDETLTDASGDYVFNDVAADLAHQVMLVEPLGYTADQNYVAQAVACNGTETINFVLTPFVLANNARSKGYWKHQFDVYVKNRGNAQEEEADLQVYVDEVRDRYTLPHYQTIFADMADGVGDFEEWQAALSVKGNAGMEAKAMSQLAALALNIMSLKIGQYEVVTIDDRTAGDVLTYVSELLTDGNSSNDELAKDLAESVNLQETIADMIVPDGGTQYRTDPPDLNIPTVTRLHGASPNPARQETRVGYDLAVSGEVRLTVFNVLGQRVAVLVDEMVTAGNHGVVWDGTDGQGRSLGNGLYLMRLDTESTTEVRSVVLAR